METKKKALGKGLEQLFANNVIDFDNFEKEIVTEAKKDNGIAMIKIADIRSNPYQPRKSFNEDTLNELAQSIKEYGLVQPIIVKKSIKGYELVAGERRCKASRIAGLTEIPAIIKDFTDDEMMELALIENIQREDLNSIDEAKSVMNIIKLKGYTQEEFALKFGKSRTYVTNLLGLLNLPNDVQELVILKKISPSHARLLSKLDDPLEINRLANRIMLEKLNVRDLEDIVNNVEVVKRKPLVYTHTDPKYRIYENVISDKVGNKVKVKKNKIEISFDSLKDLERIMDILNISIGED